MTLFCGLEGGEAERAASTGLLRSIGRETSATVGGASLGGASLADEATELWFEVVGDVDLGDADLGDADLGDAGVGAVAERPGCEGCCFWFCV